MALQSDTPARRAMIGPVLMTIGAAVTLVGAFSGWLRSGRVARSSFELLGVIQRLGFVPNGATRVVVRAWPVMPLLLTVGVVVVWWGWRRIGAAVASFAAIYAGAVGSIVAFAAPDARGVELSGAPRVTAIGAVVVLLGSLFAVAVRVPSADANP